MTYANNLMKDAIKKTIRSFTPVADEHEQSEMGDPLMYVSWIGEGTGVDRASMYCNGRFHTGILISIQDDDDASAQTSKPKTKESTMYEPIQENIREISVVLTQEAFLDFQQCMEKEIHPNEPRANDLWTHRACKSPYYPNADFVRMTWRHLEMSKLHPAINHLHHALDTIESKYPNSNFIMSMLESRLSIGVRNRMGRNVEVNRLLAQRLAIVLHPDRKYVQEVTTWVSFRNEQEAKQALDFYVYSLPVLEQRVDLARWWEDGLTIRVDGGFVKMLIHPQTTDQLNTVKGFGKWLVRGDGPEVPFYYLDNASEHGCLQLSPYNITKAVDEILEKNEATEKAKEASTTLNNICLIGPGNLKGALVALRRRCFDENTMPSEKIVDFLTKASLTFAGGSQMLVWSDVAIADDDILEQFLNEALIYLERKEPGKYQYVRVNKSSKCVHQLGVAQSQFSASVHNFMKDFYTSL